MAKKQISETDRYVKDAVEEWRSLAEMRGELAREAYDYQDDATKAVIDRIVTRLRLGASGYIEVRVNPPKGNLVAVKIEQAYLDFNLMYVALELLKDLALFDIRVGSFQFPPSLCSSCGAEIIAERPRKRGKRAAA